MNEIETQPPPRTISGKWVVLGMFAFGLLGVGIMWEYAVVELGPFEPLAKAIKAEFPGSHPHVKGGRPRNKPPLLRIVMEVDFAPTATDPRVATISERVIELAKQHVKLSDYEDFELHLLHYVPEKAPERVTIEKNISELID
ncbi:MAG TPA: hypothetical protein VGM05_29435 [Planctomycetaceae bacterium]|jgi:hypothetical protein